MGRITNFPNGIASFGMPLLGMGDELVTTGKVFFVDSNNPGGQGTKERPFATIDEAIGNCTANKGDIIFVMPGHDENPTASITMDVAGVWIRGLGWGDMRPTVTFGAAGAAVDMSAASCRISNIVFDLGTVAATVTNCFNITAHGCIVENCEIREHATSQFTNFLTATDVERVVIRNNKFQGLAATSGTSGIVVDGCDYLTIVGNEISGAFIEHALDNTTPASCDEILRATIVGNIIVNYSATAGDLAVEMDANATGVMAYNQMGTGLALDAGIDLGNMLAIENYLTDAVDVHAVIRPATAAAN